MATKHQLSPDEACQLARRHAQNGNLAEAERILQKVLRAMPQHAMSLHEYGLLELQMGHDTHALDLLRHAVAAAPRRAQYHSNFGVALQRLGRLEEAEAVFRRVLELAPGEPAGNFDLGSVLQKLGRLAEAEAAYRRAVALDPDHAGAWNNLGTVLQLQKDFTKARKAYLRSITLAPDDPEAHNNHGRLLETLGRASEAEAAYRQAVALAPDHPLALKYLGRLLRRARQFDEAEAICCRLVAVSPDDPEAYYNLALAHRFCEGDPLLGTLKRRLRRHPPDTPGRTRLLLALGKAHEEIGRYGAAFGYYKKANRQSTDRADFDPARQRVQIQRIKAAFPVALPCHGRDTGDTTPIVVVGMSRAGKTLVESLLAQHPAVIGAGERHEWTESLDQVRTRHGIPASFPDCLDQLTGAQIRELGERYLEALRQRMPGGRYYVNTLPGLYRHIGLMFRAFPSVKVVYCRRDPLDHCLAVYFTIYADGNGYSYDLGYLAAYYRNYCDLMAHWVALHPERILTVHYERLVRAPLDVAREVYAHCGLDIDPTRLRAEFTTAEIGRAQRYEAHLAPLRAALDAPAVT